MYQIIVTRACDRPMRPESFIITNLARLDVTRFYCDQPRQNPHVIKILMTRPKLDPILSRQCDHIFVARLGVFPRDQAFIDYPSGKVRCVQCLFVTSGLVSDVNKVFRDVEYRLSFKIRVVEYTR